MAPLFPRVLRLPPHPGTSSTPCEVKLSKATTVGGAGKAKLVWGSTSSWGSTRELDRGQPASTPDPSLAKPTFACGQASELIPKTAPRPVCGSTLELDRGEAASVPDRSPAEVVLHTMKLSRSPYPAQQEAFSTDHACSGEISWWIAGWMRVEVGINSADGVAVGSRFDTGAGLGAGSVGVGTPGGSCTGTVGGPPSWQAWGSGGGQLSQPQGQCCQQVG